MKKTTATITLVNDSEVYKTDSFKDAERVLTNYNCARLKLTWKEDGRVETETFEEGCGRELSVILMDLWEGQ